MLERFGVDPARLMSMSVRQFNAVCDYAAERARRAMEDSMLDELRESVHVL